MKPENQNLSPVLGKTGLALVISSAAWLTFGVGDARAQSTVYCPTSFANLPQQNGHDPGSITNPVTFTNGACTNGSAGVGAFSGAAVAAQALSDLAQSTTQQVTTSSAAAIEQRRNEERERCDDGLIRRGGECVRPPRVVPVPQVKQVPRGKKVEEKLAVRKRRGANAFAQGGTLRQADPVPPAARPTPMFVETGVRFGTWAQAFGEFDQRRGTGQASITYTTPAPQSVDVLNGINIVARSTTKTGGFLAGLDGTKRNLFAAGDGLIGGALVGYMDSTVNIHQTLYAKDTTMLDNGASSFRGHVSGPSLGLYLTYFNGPFSVDSTARVDLLNFAMSFSDARAFTGVCDNFCGGFGISNDGSHSGWGYKQLVPFSGSGSTRATQFSSIQNAQYRFTLSPTFWLEPTVGYQFSHISYDASAAFLGLADGNLLRIQGGARLGWSFSTGRTLFTPTITALLYDNVAVTGGFIQAGTFGPSAVALSDAHKVRVEGAFGLNAEHGDGWKSFAQISLRGGQDYFGIGAKGGIRYEW